MTKNKPLVISNGKTGTYISNEIVTNILRINLKNKPEKSTPLITPVISELIPINIFSPKNIFFICFGDIPKIVQIPNCFPLEPRKAKEEYPIKRNAKT